MFNLQKVPHVRESVKVVGRKGVQLDRLSPSTLKQQALDYVHNNNFIRLYYFLLNNVQAC